MNRYSYDELKNKALATEATQADIDQFGKWFEQYGDIFWNGEVYAIDDNHSLKPIYIEVGEDGFELSHFEIV